MLVVGFAEPWANPQKSEMVKNFETRMIINVVSKKAKWGSPFSNEVLQALEKRFCFGNGFWVNDMGFATNENLCLGETSFDSRRVGMDLVSEQVILESKHIKCRIR